MDDGPEKSRPLGVGPVLCTGFGQSDTHAETLNDGRPKSHPSAGIPYAGITGKQIVAMVKDPPSLPKEQAQWLISSTYRASDARSHEAQREQGEFWLLALDVDRNNLPRKVIAKALDAVCGKCCWMIYATRSATPENRKWRALVPLMDPVSGADYAETATAFYDLLEDATGGELIPDRALARPAQLVYLPNRGAFYEQQIVKADRLRLSADHPIIRRRDENRQRRALVEAEARAWRDRRRASVPTGAGSIVERFNADHDLETLLERYGYQRAGHSKDWRSPYQTSGSHATRVEADHWISLSESDAAAGLGRASKSGARFGDAFDLFCHYDHGGDYRAAVRAYAEEAGLDHKSSREQAPAAEANHPADPQDDDAFFKRGADLHGLPVPEREWLVPDLVPMKTVTMLGGDGGTGKSLLALQLAVAVATGKAWLGRSVKEGSALVLSAEDDDDELHRRQLDIVRAQGDTLASLKRFMFRSMAGQDALLALLEPGTGRLVPSQLYLQLDRAMKAERPVVLILDTTADLFPGNENDRAQVRQFIGLLRALAIRHNCAVILLAHPSLTGMSSGSGLSGSTAWNNSVRSRLYLERLIVDGYEADTKARRLTSKKANYGPTGHEIGMKWQAGVFVAEEPETGLDKMAATAKAERVFLRLLRQFTEQGRRVNANGGPTYAPKVFAESTEAEGVTKRAFKAAMDALFHAGKIKNETTGSPSRPVTFIAFTH